MCLKVLSKLYYIILYYKLNYIILNKFKVSKEFV